MVHLFGSTLLILGIAVLVSLTQVYSESAAFLWLLTGFLIGKFCSYVASAYLHRSNYTCTSIVAHKRSMQIDFLAVNTSIFATAIPTAVHHCALYYITACALTTLSGVFIVLEWELSRLVVTITQFALTVVFIGYTTFWNGIWIIGSVSYVAAFACFGPVALGQGKGAELQEATLPCAVWHKVGRNGCHEDFHTFLFVADAFYFVNAILLGPTCR